MNLDAILSRLHKVRKTGPQNWLACCPAHDDRNPSMTLRDAGDGRVLANCHAGCTFDEIVGAVELGWQAWFPQGTQGNRPITHAYPAADVLEALALEASIVAIAAHDIAEGKKLSAEDAARVSLAAQRINDGRDLALGERAKFKPTLKAREDAHG